MARLVTRGKDWRREDRIGEKVSHREEEEHELAMRQGQRRKTGIKEKRRAEKKRTLGGEWAWKKKKKKCELIKGEEKKRRGKGK